MSRAPFARARPREARDFRGARRRDEPRRSRAHTCDAQSSGSVSTHRALGQFRRITTDMARLRGRGRAVGWLLARTGTAWAQGGPLRVGLPTVSPTLDPATALEGPVSVIARQMFDTLVQYREIRRDIEPGLASQWSVSRDGLVWTFRLRDGVRFQDGTVLTAQHVVESLDRVLQPSAPHAPSPNVASRLVRGTPGVVKEVRAVDSRTVQISLLLPYAPLPAVLAHPAFSIVLAGSLGQRWIGTGPFRLTEASAARVVLDAHAAYWEGPPRLAPPIFPVIGEVRDRVAMLEDQGAGVVLMDTAPERPLGVLSVPAWATR